MISACFRPLFWGKDRRLPCRSSIAPHFPRPACGVSTLSNFDSVSHSEQSRTFGELLVFPAHRNST
jgi:hypothetical protein